MSNFKVNTLSHSWAGKDGYSPKEKAREKSYNHEYYMKNKDKWGVSKTTTKSTDVKKEDYKENDPDFADENYNEKNRLGDSDFFGFKDKNGQWTIIEEDMKWKLPKGQEIDDEMIRKLSEFEGFNDSKKVKTHQDWDNAVSDIINKRNNLSDRGYDTTTGKEKEKSAKEFDVDAAAKDIISGKYGNGEERKKALGDDYEKVQNRVNELTGSKKRYSENKSKTTTKSSTQKTVAGASASTKKIAAETQKRTSAGIEAGRKRVKTTNDVEFEYKDGMPIPKKKTTVKHDGFYDGDYLTHHGILGQKWGVRRYQNPDGTLTLAGKRRQARIESFDNKNYKLQKRVDKKQLKSDKYSKKSEDRHAKYDLKRANRAMKKSEKYAIKADKIRKKETLIDDPYKKVKLEAKAAKKSYKSSKYYKKGDILSKETGYGIKALNYSMKSNKLAAKAEKGRMKIANNKRIQALMNEDITKIPTLKQRQDEINSYVYKKAKKEINAREKSVGGLDKDYRYDKYEELLSTDKKLQTMVNDYNNAKRNKEV